MYQKRKRPSFKTDLRAQLLNKALELNEAPSKRGFAWSNWQNIFVKRVAPALAAVMLVVFAFQFLIPSGSLLPQLVNVAEAKDYYTLTPTQEDSTGVASESTFVLSSKGTLDLEEIQAQMSVEPKTELSFKKISNKEVAISPEENLEPGEIYSFSLQAQNLSNSPYPKEYNWAYEISDGFRITGTLPGYEEAGVPINTGIEIYFTHNGIEVEALEKAFSITPNVEGTFEVNGKIGIFKPSDDLEEATIYTVTIDKSLALPDSDKNLKTDYRFEFETDNTTRAVINTDFSKDIYEFSPAEAPKLQIYYWDNASLDYTVDLSVYAYKSNEEYLNAIQGYRTKAPLWTYYSREFFEPSVDGLNKVLGVPEYHLVEQDGYFIELEAPLPSGYYLLQIKKEDAVGTAFLQVSDTAVYLNLNEENALVWVNSIETGEVVAEAEVAIINSSLSTKTNADGVATFNKIYDELGINRNENKSVFFQVSVDGHTTYYEAPLYLYGENSNDEYWQFLQTERTTYLPTDTVHYWGFVQGRTSPIQDEAEVYLLKGYSWNYELTDMLTQQAIIEKNVIDLKNGEAFYGALDLKNLSSDAYEILIVQNDKILTHTSFYVQDYVKPAYDLTLSSPKTALFDGETANVTVHAAFFEGTPVPHAKFMATLPTGEQQLITTDADGDAQLSWTARKTDCTNGGACYLYSTDYLTVSPVQEEMGEITQNMVFRTFNSTTLLDTNKSLFNKEKFEFQAYKVDLESIDYDASQFENYKNYEKIYGEPDSKSTAQISITQVEYTAREVGEYYDSIDKVMRKKYEYDRKETLLKTVTLNPNGQGLYHYEPQLSDTYDYDILVKIYDAQGNYYDEMHYVNNGKNYYGYSSNLALSIVGWVDWQDSYFHTGDEVKLELSGLKPEETWNGNFLYLETQNGIQKYTLTDVPSYELTFDKKDIPNVGVNAVYFDGNHLRLSNEQSLMLNTDDRRMELEVNTDKSRYEPGEEVTLKVQSSEAAQVNLYLVDEAYYSLFSESFRDPLDLIYAPVSNGVAYTYVSHEIIVGDEGGKGGCFVAGTQILMADGSSKNIEDIQVGDKVLTRTSEWDATLTEVTVMNTIEHSVGEYLLVNNNLGVTEEHVIFINGQWQLAKDLKVGDTLLNQDGEVVLVESIVHVRNNVKVYNFETENKHTYFANGIYVHNNKGDAREDFRDTAFFTVVNTDANGIANVTFTLPDNITSWRISAAAVSGGDEIHAAYTSANIEVSKPLFVNPVINSSYLAGDEPSLPVRAYGDQLEAGMEVAFSMSLDKKHLGDQMGKAFETSYFKLPALETGLHKITSSAKANTLNDTVILPTTVTTSHLSEETVNTQLLKEGGTIKGSDTDRTEVHFLNNEIGIIYETLLNAYFNDGDRADESLVRSLAGSWLNENFGKEYPLSSYSAAVFQDSSTGGVSLLPYADANLELSAKMAALGPDYVNKSSLIPYFEAILNDPNRTLNEKILSLYGLAALGQSYLTELNYFVDHFELDLEDKLYAALAYAEYGEDAKATEFFLEIYQERDAKWNASLASLAECIGSDLSTVLWSAALEAEKAEENIFLEKMLYAKVRLENGASLKVSFQLNGEKIVLTGSQTMVKSFLPNELKKLDISNVDGEVIAVSSYETPIDLDTTKVSNKVTVSRSYWVNGKQVNSLKTGDIVEVHLAVTSSLKDSNFKLTDHLPSGMQTVTAANQSPDVMDYQEYRHPYNQEGQKIGFYVSCYENRCTKAYEFYYLARVINPGNFVLEPAVIQNYEDLNLINISGERGTLTIE